ncbi:MAG: hypothetical protein P8Z68_09645, partial [Kineosporiaceae bacterium]
MSGHSAGTSGNGTSGNGASGSGSDDDPAGAPPATGTGPAERPGAGHPGGRSGAGHPGGGHPGSRAALPPGQAAVPSARVDYAQRPMLVFWETTRACGLACAHCRASATLE